MESVRVGINRAYVISYSLKGRLEWIIGVTASVIA